MIFFGWFADAYGRIPALMASNILFLITRLLMGLAFNTFFTMPYVLVLEYVAIDKRTLVGNIGLALALTLSGTYQPWLAKNLAHWKPFNWAIFSQMITIFAIPFLLPESCRWLISKGQTEKTVKILRRI